MNRFAANFSQNSAYNSLSIPVQLISIKRDIAKLKKMPRAARGRLMKAYEQLKMNTKLDTTQMRRNNNPDIIDLGKLYKNLEELKEIFKNYREVRTRNNGVWNTTNNKRGLIDLIEKKIDRTIENIDKQKKAEKKQRENAANAHRFRSIFPEEPYNKNLTGKKLEKQFLKLPSFPPPYAGGSLFVNVKGVGKRKVRYYKNGNKYVLVKGKKKKI